MNLAPTYQITVQATSSDGSSSSTDFTIDLNNLNDAPIAVDDSLSVAENGLQGLDVLQNDYDLDPGDNFSITHAHIVSGLGSLTFTAGQLQFNPGLHYDYLSVGESETIVIEYVIEDVAGLSDIAQATLTIHGSRDALTLNAPDLLIAEDSVFSWPILISQVDINGESLTSVTVVGLPEGTVFRDLANQLRLVNANQTVELFGLDLPSLTVELPEHIAGVFNVTISTQSDLGSSSLQSISRRIELTSVADSPVVGADDARGQLGTHIPIVLSSALVDVDDSESLVLRLRGIPVGISISDSIHQIVSESVSNWYDISNFDLAKLYLDTSGGIDGTFELEFSATAVEGLNQDEATSTVRFEVVIDQVLPVFELGNELTVSTSEPASASPDQGLETFPDDAATATETVPDGAGEIEQEFILVMEQLSTLLATIEGSSDQNEVNAFHDLVSRESLSFELSTFEISELNTYRDINSVESANIFEAFSYANSMVLEATAQVFTDSNSVDGVTGVNSAVLMMWNMIRFTISTLPSSRDQDIVDDVRYSQTNQRSQRR